jgi:hypothetical protein
VADDPPEGYSNPSQGTPTLTAATLVTVILVGVAASEKQYPRGKILRLRKCEQFAKNAARPCHEHEEFSNLMM